MLGMVRTLQDLGFEARGLEGEISHLDRVPLPFIAHTIGKDGWQHYVVVCRWKPGKVKVMDPAWGQIRHYSTEDFAALWSGKLIAALPARAWEEESMAPSVPQRMYQLLKPLWKSVFQAAVAALLYTILGLSSSIYLGKITDHVFVSQNTSLLNTMSLGMLIIVLSMVGLSLLRNLTLLRSGQVMDNQLILGFYRKIFRLPQSFFSSMKTGEIMTRIGDALKIRSFLNESLMHILVNALILLFSFGTMFLIYPKLAFLILLMVPLNMALFAFFNHRNRKTERAVMEGAASLEDRLLESLGKSRQIRQFGIREEMEQQVELKLNKLLDRTYLSSLVSIGVTAASEGLNRVFTILLLWLGSTLVLDGDLSAGRLLTFYALLGYCSAPMAALVGSNKAYQNARIAMDRLGEIFDLEEEERKDLPVFPGEAFGNVELKGVRFAYGSRGSQVKDANIRISRGEITLINGPSGSGKSTLAALVAHLNRPDHGCIRIGNCDTANFSLDSLRALMGVLPQHIRLLKGSLLENLSSWDRQPDLFRISSLLRQLGLLETVESLPGGLHYRFKGSTLPFSGGELQRLGMVRALYADPPILVLDEPSSGLDPPSTSGLADLLCLQKEAGKSILLISHDEKLARLADRIYRMEQGRTSPVSASPQV
jgi:ATP-binding cassette subfamily B protein